MPVRCGAFPRHQLSTLFLAQSKRHFLISIPFTLLLEMFGLLKVAAMGMAVCPLALATPVKRAAMTDVSLYAYGGNLSGVSVFYGDGKRNDSPNLPQRCTHACALGKAYIGSTIPDWLDVASNITCKSSILRYIVQHARALTEYSHCRHG